MVSSKQRGTGDGEEGEERAGDAVSQHSKPGMFNLKAINKCKTQHVTLPQPSNPQPSVPPSATAEPPSQRWNATEFLLIRRRRRPIFCALLPLILLAEELVVRRPPITCLRRQLLNWVRANDLVPKYFAMNLPERSINAPSDGGKPAGISSPLYGNPTNASYLRRALEFAVLQLSHLFCLFFCSR